MGVVILFGAGASYGSEAVQPYTPPLGNDLFPELEKLGGIAANMPQAIKDVFYGPGKFEEGMAAYYEYSGGDIMSFQREIAGYLAQFTPEAGNVYADLIEAIGVEKVIYSSLNYDLLLELSAERVGYQITYSISPIPNTARVLKIHGSCNIWPDYGSDLFIGLSARGNREADIQAGVIFLRREPTLLRSADATGDAPALAMYAKGKAVKVCPIAVRNQQARWEIMIKHATDVVLVGVKVTPEDNHIWGELAKTKASIHYFGLGPDETPFLDWVNASGRNNAHFTDATFRQALPEIRAITSAADPWGELRPED